MHNRKSVEGLYILDFLNTIKEAVYLFYIHIILMINILKKILISVCSVLMMLGLSMTAYAANQEIDLKARNIENVQTFVDENIARVTGAARGSLISTVELSIEDLGGGTARIYGDVLCHKKMKKIKLNMILDQWNTETEQWSKVEKFELTWLAEDYPDQDLTMACASIDVPNLERGRNYRARAVAGAWDYDSSYYEVWSESTPSILVE